MFALASEMPRSLPLKAILTRVGLAQGSISPEVQAVHDN